MCSGDTVIQLCVHYTHNLILFVAASSLSLCTLDREQLCCDLRCNYGLNPINHWSHYFWSFSVKRMHAIVWLCVNAICKRQYVKVQRVTLLLLHVYVYVCVCVCLYMCMYANVFVECVWIRTNLIKLTACTWTI